MKCLCICYVHVCLYVPVCLLCAGLLVCACFLFLYMHMCLFIHVCLWKPEVNLERHLQWSPTIFEQHLSLV